MKNINYFRIWNTITKKFLSKSEIEEKSIFELFSNDFSYKINLSNQTFDKNGVEMFEGDLYKCIVEIHYENNGPGCSISSPVYGYFLIKKTEAGNIYGLQLEYKRVWTKVENFRYSYEDGLYKDITVLGNIYESPNLLEEITKEKNKIYKDKLNQLVESTSQK